MYGEPKDLSFRGRWLNQHGGRIGSDVYQDEEGEYILMTVGKNKEMKVYIPSGQPVDKPTKAGDSMGTRSGELGDSRSGYPQPK